MQRKAAQSSAKSSAKQRKKQSSVKERRAAQDTRPRAWTTRAHLCPNGVIEGVDAVLDAAVEQPLGVLFFHAEGLMVKW
jgi:hypothetical protein